MAASISDQIVLMVDSEVTESIEESTAEELELRHDLSESSGESILLMQLQTYLQFQHGKMTTMVEGDGDSSMIKMCITAWKSTIAKFRSKNEQHERLQSKYNSLLLKNASLAAEKSFLATEKSSVEKCTRTFLTLIKIILRIIKILLSVDSVVFSLVMRLLKRS